MCATLKQKASNLGGGGPLAPRTVQGAEQGTEQGAKGHGFAGRMRATSNRQWLPAKPTKP